jgi:hypothetical protein
MTVKQAKIAFIDAREALNVAKFETIKASKRLDLLKRKGASPVLVKMAEEDLENAFGVEDDAREARIIARQALEIAVGMDSIDRETGINVEFERLMARLDRFVAGL